MYCKECGSKIIEGNRFCHKCGAKIMQEKGKRNSVLFAGIVILVAVGAWIGLSSMEKQDEEKSITIEEEKQEIKTEKNIVKEGSYIYNSEQEVIHVYILNDCQGISCITLEYENYKRDISFYEEYKYDRKEFVKSKDGAAENCKIELEQEEQNILLTIKDAEFMENRSVKVEETSYFDLTSAILGVKNYLMQGKYKNLESTCDYSSPTNGKVEGWFHEMYMIPICDAKNIERGIIYYALVTSPDFEEEGETNIYRAREVVSVLEGQASFEEIEELESFNVKDYL